jgi:hypothetical protein
MVNFFKRNFTRTNMHVIKEHNWNTGTQAEAAMSEAVLKGETGKLYRFAVLRPDEAFPEGPAVYAFAKPNFSGRGWTPVFLSRTANLAVRMANHERWEEARLLGATDVLLLSFPERADREACENDLCAAIKPVMNDGTPALEEDTPLTASGAVHFFPPIRVGLLKSA